MFGDTDLPALFNDMGIAVVFGGKTVKGLLDLPMQIKLADQGFGGVEAAFPEVRLPYNAFSPMPDEGATVNVDGTSYTVAERTAESDGAVVCLALKAVTR